MILRLLNEGGCLAADVVPWCVRPDDPLGAALPQLLALCGGPFEDMDPVTFRDLFILGELHSRYVTKAAAGNCDGPIAACEAVLRHRRRSLAALRALDELGAAVSLPVHQQGLALNEDLYGPESFRVLSLTASPRALRLGPGALICVVRRGLGVPAPPETPACAPNSLDCFCVNNRNQGLPAPPQREAGPSEVAATVRPRFRLPTAAPPTPSPPATPLAAPSPSADLSTIRWLSGDALQWIRGQERAESHERPDIGAVAQGGTEERPAMVVFEVPGASKRLPMPVAEDPSSKSADAPVWALDHSLPAAAQTQQALRSCGAVTPAAVCMTPPDVLARALVRAACPDPAAVGAAVVAAASATTDGSGLARPALVERLAAMSRWGRADSERGASLASAVASVVDALCGPETYASLPAHLALWRGVWLVEFDAAIGSPRPLSADDDSVGTVLEVLRSSNPLAAAAAARDRCQPRAVPWLHERSPQPAREQRADDFDSEGHHHATAAPAASISDDGHPTHSVPAMGLLRPEDERKPTAGDASPSERRVRFSEPLPPADIHLSVGSSDADTLAKRPEDPRPLSVGGRAEASRGVVRPQSTVADGIDRLRLLEELDDGAPSPPRWRATAAAVSTAAPPHWNPYSTPLKKPRRRRLDTIFRIATAGDDSDDASVIY